MICPECKKSKKHRVMSKKPGDICDVRPCFCEDCGAVFKTFEFALDGEEGRDLYQRYIQQKPRHVEKV